MKNIRFISRSDDLGSSKSANKAIDVVTRAGFIKNVSVMACGPEIEDAARIMAQRKDICFGMHMTINSEWDKVKWGPVSQVVTNCGLTDESGYFLSDPSLFLQTKPPVELIIQEISAQLDKLCKLGFDIKYIDSHMFPEMFIEGLDEAVESFAKEKGLLDHMYYYAFPQGFDLGGILSGEAALADIPDGQYFMVTHPSLDTPEMRLTGNSKVSGEMVAASRAKETDLLSQKGLCSSLQKLGICGIRYDEAAYSARLSVDDMKKILAK